MGGMGGPAGPGGTNGPGDYYMWLFGNSQKQLKSLMGNAPQGAPDLSDPAVQAARQAQLLSSQMGETRKSTFLTDGEGLAPPTVGTKTLLGG